MWLRSRPVAAPTRALRALAQDGYTPLILAAGRGNTAMMRELISFQANVNLRSRVRASTCGLVRIPRRAS